MEWWIWFTRWFLFNFWHSRLFLIYHKKRRNFGWKSTSSNLCEQDWKRNCFQTKNGIKIRIVNSWNNEVVGKHKNNGNKDKDGENVPKLVSVEVVLVHCNLVKNGYQHTSKVLFTFVPNKQFGQLINISPHSLTMMNTINTEFLFCWSLVYSQVSKALEVEDNVNLTLIIG